VFDESSDEDDVLTINRPRFAKLKAITSHDAPNLELDKFVNAESERDFRKKSKSRNSKRAVRTQTSGYFGDDCRGARYERKSRFKKDKSARKTQKSAHFDESCRYFSDEEKRSKRKNKDSVIATYRSDHYDDKSSVSSPATENREETSSSYQKREAFGGGARTETYVVSESDEEYSRRKISEVLPSESEELGGLSQVANFGSKRLTKDYSEETGWYSGEGLTSDKSMWDGRYSRKDMTSDQSEENGRVVRNGSASGETGQSARYSRNGLLFDQKEERGRYSRKDQDPSKRGTMGQNSRTGLSSDQHLSRERSDPIGISLHDYDKFRTGHDENTRRNLRQSSPIDLSKVQAKQKSTSHHDPHKMASRENNTNTSGEKEDLKKLSDFRKDHYFDTHSTEDFFKSVPEHTCVHKFALDDRFLPEPLHADVFGESRCIICDKPMDIPPVSRVDQRYGKKKGLFPKFYRYGLAPKKIYMASDDKVRIEMELAPCQDGDYVVKTEKPSYFNTYALRYQRGVK
jgi:hypothetical protein